MAGIVRLAPGTSWKAASWLFDWVLDAMANATSMPALAELLRETVDQNLGWLALDDLAVDQRRELIDELIPQLARWADEQLPRPMVLDGSPLTADQRKVIVDHVATLVELATVLWDDSSKDK